MEVIWKIVSWLLILIFILFLLVGGASLLWKAAKAGLAYFGVINYPTIDYTAINENAVSTLDSLIRDINKCRASKDNNCACEASLSGFYETHKLETNGNEIKLVNIKEKNEITMRKEGLQGLNCYLDGKNIKKLDKLEILFDKDPAYIPISGLFSSNAQFDKSLKIYKDNELCWITSKADLTNIKICS